MRTVEVKLYQFDELSDEAKEKAREWWRECESQEFGSFGELYEPAETAAEHLGIEFDTTSVRLHGGKTREEPVIYWQLHTQGSGASFAGRYSYKKGGLRAIRKEFVAGKEIQRIALELYRLQRNCKRGLSAKITHSGRDSHKYAMSFDVELEGDTGYQVRADGSTFTLTFGVRDAFITIMHDFADWIYKGIEDEYDYRMSDESVDESIRANEYEFTEYGERS